MLDMPVKTPCVGICSTSLGGDVCRGCKRFAHEVIDWNSYNNTQKQIIENRLSSFLSQIVQAKLFIADPDLLAWQIETQCVRVSKHRDQYCQAYEFIKAGGNQITDAKIYGISIFDEFKGYSMKAFCELIDSEFYALSQAHYQRYIIANAVDEGSL